MAKTEFDKRLAEYQKSFKLGDLNTSNDQATLYALIRSELMLERLQSKMNTLVEEEDTDLMKSAQELKKLSDLIKDTINNVTAMQRTLAIDRKSRQDDAQQSVAEYINGLKRIAQEWLDKLFIKVYCPNCKVLVSRIIPAHEHTHFTLTTECSQCGKAVRAQRQGKDVFFDIRNADWRKKHPVEIVQPEKSEDSGFEIQDSISNNVNDDVVIESSAEVRILTENQIKKPAPVIREDLFIGGKADGTNTSS